MKNLLLRTARQQKGWSQQQLADFSGISLSTIERAERGEPIRVDSIERLCSCLEKTPEQLGLIRQRVNRRQVNTGLMSLVGAQFLSTSPIADFYVDDLLTIYASGIAACQDLYYSGSSHHVAAILPLYQHQTSLLAQQSSPLRKTAARLASHANLLKCELATDREDFGAAQQAGQQAFTYAQLADDPNLQVAALISLATLNFHRKLSTAALRDYTQAVSLLDDGVTPLLKGRTYAGLAEVYAMRGPRYLQDAMNALGLAYEFYPLKPEEDPAYAYHHSSRYSLYVFGDAQTRLFLGQPKEADKALVAMQQETNTPQTEPLTKLDMLFYQAEIHVQQGNLEEGSTILTEGAMLAKNLGSRLYFNKLALIYQKRQKRWPRENMTAALEDVFQLW